MTQERFNEYMSRHIWDKPIAFDEQDLFKAFRSRIDGLYFKRLQANSPNIQEEDTCWPSREELEAKLTLICRCNVVKFYHDCINRKYIFYKNQQNEQTA